MGCFWYSGHPWACYYNHVMPPNTWSCAYFHPSLWPGGSRLPGHWDGAVTASSRHPDVVNALMCDGSVRTIKETIAPVVWWALGTRSGGEVISSSDY